MEDPSRSDEIGLASTSETSWRFMSFSLSVDAPRSMRPPWRIHEGDGADGAFSTWTPPTRRAVPGSRTRRRSGRPDSVVAADTAVGGGHVPRFGCAVGEAVAQVRGALRTGRRRF